MLIYDFYYFFDFKKSHKCFYFLLSNNKIEAEMFLFHSSKEQKCWKYLIEKGVHKDFITVY